MNTLREKITITKRSGEQLAALLELPAAGIKAYALFVHCFTCGKNLGVASRISRALAVNGIATLRFDFTGLGGSDGDFANTNFSSNLEDIGEAAEYLAQYHQAPTLLIGHSLGGTAVLAVAAQLPSVTAVVTIGAPSDPALLVDNFEAQLPAIEEQGQASVTLADRSFTIKKQFLDDIRSHPLSERIGSLRRALLIFHSPLDLTVSIDEAAAIFQAARHPKSFITLDRADHLVSAPEDARFIAATISAWVKRYLPAADEDRHPEVESGHVLVTEQNRRFTRGVYSDTHQWLCDEPLAVGGDDLGPDPYEHLVAALGACTSMTMRMYANRKAWPVEDIYVTVQHYRCHGDDCARDLEPGTTEKLDVLERLIRIEGERLSEPQRQRLLDIADRCPVHRTLSGELRIRTRIERGRAGTDE